MASASAVPGSTSRLARPMRCASSPDTPRPVRMRSRAWPWPSRRARRMVPPSMRGTPQRRQKTPNTASRAATRRSHHAASSRPPATAYPSTAASTGLESSMRDGPIGPSPSSVPRLPRPSDTPFRSAPAQNVPPAPVSTATGEESSASKRRKASASAAAVGPSTAFRTAGRSMVTIVTAPSRSQRTVDMWDVWDMCPPIIAASASQPHREEGAATEVFVTDRQADLVAAGAWQPQRGQRGGEDALEASAHLARRPCFQAANDLDPEVTLGVDDLELHLVTAARVHGEAREDPQRRQREVGDVEGVEEADERVLVPELEPYVVTQGAQQELRHLGLAYGTRAGRSRAQITPSRFSASSSSVVSPRSPQ